MNGILEFPFEFWAALLLLCFGCVWATKHVTDGLGLPVLAVLGTVGTWYFVDVFYNGYQKNYAWKFTEAVFRQSWFQVAVFLATFLILVGPMNSLMNRRQRQLSSYAVKLAKMGISDPELQANLKSLFIGCVLVWAVLATLAAITLGNRWHHYFFPYLDYVLSPWSRPRVGSGLDALRSLAAYLQLFVVVMFGLVAALAENGKVRRWAVILCLLSWPFYFFNRARSSMLVVALPAILAWVFLRLRGGMIKKTLILAGFFLFLDLWFGLVIQTRSFMSVAQALQERGLSLSRAGETQHLGLNMFGELCWINTFIEAGLYEANWGQGYFAELVNPIPRSLWPGKPMINVEYAILRGQGGGSLIQAGLNASMSNGMIGQGVVNFGQILGPPFAALLMSLWTALLARLDKNGDRIGRLTLYGLGMALTFNMGRDITLITLYPFVFGMGIIWWLDQRQSSRQPVALRVQTWRR